MWGLHFYELMFLFYCLPYQQSNTDAKWKFLSSTFQLALNNIDNSCDLHDATRFIIDNKQEYAFTREDVTYASLLSKHFQTIKALFPQQTINSFIKVRPKGVGVICNSKEGIKANTYLTDYLGVIYLSHTWLDREEILRRYKK